MSEDQIHYELSIIRTLINESNADLSQAIRVANENTLINVQARNNELKKDVERQHTEMCENVKSQLSGIKGMVVMLITILLSFGGWLSLDHLTLKDDHKELKTDFGTVLLITSPDNVDFIGYEDLLNKYFPARGQKWKP